MLIQLNKRKNWIINCTYLTIYSCVKTHIFSYFLSLHNYSLFSCIGLHHWMCTPYVYLSALYSIRTFLYSKLYGHVPYIHWLLRQGVLPKATHYSLLALRCSNNYIDAIHIIIIIVIVIVVVVIIMEKTEDL